MCALCHTHVENLLKGPATSSVKNANVKKIGLLSKNFTFSSSSSLKLNCSTTVFDTTYLCAVVFRADTGNNREMLVLHIVAFMPGLSEWLV